MNDPIDEACRKHREENFGITISKTRNPQYSGEFTVNVTYNGYQSHSLSFTESEWGKVCQAVREFNKGGV